LAESKFTSLPSAKGRGFSSRQIWNLYREFGTNKHYYHLRPFQNKDWLIKQNIDPNDAMDLINYYNNLKK